MKKLLLIVALALSANAWGENVYLECKELNVSGDPVDSRSKKTFAALTVVINVEEETFNIAKIDRIEEVAMPLEVSELFFKAEEDHYPIQSIDLEWRLNRLDLSLVRWNMSEKEPHSYFQCYLTKRI